MNMCAECWTYKNYVGNASAEEERERENKNKIEIQNKREALCFHGPKYETLWQKIMDLIPSALHVKIERVTTK